MKGILFKLNLEGQGIVNFDEKSQRSMYFGSKRFGHLADTNDNLRYSKKVFTRDEDGNLDAKIKISSQCLMKGVFNRDMVGQNTSFVNNKDLLYSQIASPYYILNGYMMTQKDKLGFKRKSPITLTAAVQICDALPTLDVSTRSGFKNLAVDVKDVTLFNEENVNDMKYVANGKIDFNELQFMSMDDYYDRWGFNVDDFGYFEKYMKINMKSFDSKPGYFEIKDSPNSFPELGMKFSKEDVDYLVKYFLKRLLRLSINRHRGYADVVSLSVKFVNDAIDNRFNNEDGWFEIKNDSDLESINFNYDDFYQEVDFETAKQLRSLIIPITETKKSAKGKTDKEEAVKTEK